MLYIHYELINTYQMKCDKSKSNLNTERDIFGAFCYLFNVQHQLSS